MVGAGWGRRTEGREATGGDGTRGGSRSRRANGGRTSSTRQAPSGALTTVDAACAGESALSTVRRATVDHRSESCAGGTARGGRPVTTRRTTSKRPFPQSSLSCCGTIWGKARGLREEGEGGRVTARFGRGCTRGARVPREAADPSLPGARGSSFLRPPPFREARAASYARLWRDTGRPTSTSWCSSYRSKRRTSTQGNSATWTRAVRTTFATWRGSRAWASPTSSLAPSG